MVQDLSTAQAGRRAGRGREGGGGGGGERECRGRMRERGGKGRGGERDVIKGAVMEGGREGESGRSQRCVVLMSCVTAAPVARGI